MDTGVVLLISASVGISWATGLAVIGGRQLTHRLDVIHGLVNSSLTAAMVNELDALVRDAASMREVVELKRAAGLKPTKATLSVIAAADAKIAALTTAISERTDHQIVLDRMTIH